MSRVVAKLSGVTKHFGSGKQAFTALHALDLEVRAGEVLMITGPSGSGKSTCLSILGCVLSPSAGSVVIEGSEVTQLSESELAQTRLRTVGFVFQAHNLLASLSALDNVAFLARLRGMPKSQALTLGRELLAHVGLESKLDSLPANLSGGERQRVAIARALIASPRILLADEPTAALDAHNGVVTTELLCAQAKRRACAVVIVTHDPRIFHLADRRIAMEDGRIISEAA
jgi:putative ABC transport system ATP-binding protein